MHRDPPDPEELPEVFLDEAREELELKARDGYLDLEAINDDMVTRRAWELYEASQRETELAVAEMATWGQEDELGR